MGICAVYVCIDICILNFPKYKAKKSLEVTLVIRSLVHVEVNIVGRVNYVVNTDIYLKHIQDGSFQGSSYAGGYPKK